MGAQLDEISAAIGGMRSDIQNIKDDLKEIREDVASVREDVQSVNKSRWIGSGILVGLSSAGTFLAGKAGIFLAAMKP